MDILGTVAESMNNVNLKIVIQCYLVDFCEFSISVI
jgi:hypothetical protein